MIRRKGEMYFQQMVKNLLGLLPCMSSIALLMFSVPNTHPTAMHSDRARTKTGIFIPAVILSKNYLSKFAIIFALILKTKIFLNVNLKNLVNVMVYLIKYRYSNNISVREKEE